MKVRFIVALFRRRWPAAAILLYAGMASVGISWGLPSTRIDPYLFGGGPPWSGPEIADLAHAASRFSPSRGADVDANPIGPASAEPVELTANREAVAANYLRYRLYSHQPDEMITLMALAGMKPRQLQLDPRLYQYGGLFVYPVGGAIAVCGLLGWVHVTSDVAWYLDHPDEFGKFYVIARAYVALWGMVGVALVYALANRANLAATPAPPHHGGSATRRVCDAAGKLRGARPPVLRGSGRSRGIPSQWPGLLAAVLFTLMPITVCMSHEAKPHLPGAVLMLACVWYAMRYIETGRRRDWLVSCVSCGAAVGMVLSALPILILIPLAEFRRRQARQSEISNLKSETSNPSGISIPRSANRPFAIRTIGGLALALAVYFATNPYVAINAVWNREALASNLRNSTAMYEVGRAVEGSLRACALTLEGASLGVSLVGAIAVTLAALRRRWEALPLVVPAALVFVQFALLGAGKPPEYARFGVFIDAALVIAAAGVLARLAMLLPRWMSVTLVSVIVLSVAYDGWRYLHNFHKDAGPHNTREQMAGVLADDHSLRSLCVLADPAPYCCPPRDFSQVKVFRYPSLAAYLADPRGPLLTPMDGAAENSTFEVEWRSTRVGGPPYSPISWANKPMLLRRPRAH